MKHLFILLHLRHKALKKHYFRCVFSFLPLVVEECLRSVRNVFHCAHCLRFTFQSVFLSAFQLLGSQELRDTVMAVHGEPLAAA